MLNDASKPEAVPSSSKQHIAFVGYVSVHGSTRDIAAHLASELAKAGFSVTLRDLKNTPLKFADMNSLLAELKTASVVLLGSSLSHSDWQPELIPIIGFLEQELLKLPVPVHYFSVNAVGAMSSFYGDCYSNHLRRGQRLPPAISRLANTANVKEPARTHHFFAGRMQAKQYSCIDTCCVHRSHGELGDYISWQEVDNWIADVRRV